MAKRIKKKVRDHKFKSIKDKAIRDFIVQHLTEEKLDFSKFKIPSFLDILNADKDEYKSVQIQHLNQEDRANIFKNTRNLPTFGFSLLSEFSSDEN